jgi:tellurite methyltransferase
MAVLKQRSLKEQPWYEKEPWGAFWERGYRDLGVSTMGGPSHEIVEILPALPPGGKVLDLGCGEGRNSFYLASRGLDVTAIDRSAAGIEKLLTLAGRAGVDVCGIVSDIVNLDIVEDYDLVMAHGVLYYLTEMEWHDLLTQVKERTRPGGFNAYSVFIFSDDYPRPNEFKSARYTHSFAPGALRDFYADWEILRYDVYVKWDQHPGIPLHYHPIEKLVARKPGGDRPPAMIEPVPIGPERVPPEVFHSVPMGMKQEELLALCGEPDAIDTYTLDGLQIGAVTSAVEGYHLSLWFYGKAVFYLINREVWGRSLFTSDPVRLRFAGPAAGAPAA